MRNGKTAKDNKTNAKGRNFANKAARAEWLKLNRQSGNKVNAAHPDKAGGKRNRPKSFKASIKQAKA